MEYRGYVAAVEFDPETESFHGTVVNINDTISFYGRSVDELRSELATSVDEYLAMCAERGEEPDRPFSGRTLLRMGPDLHRDISLAAHRAGQSMNEWIVEALTRALDGSRERRAARTG